ncbi:hypothetical protein [Microbispora sp. NPDC046933]|uniref:hypothetical protein n=1 Tax=Microbispora sp. NPDC046933 TaxID=3155618 RepID=UPI0033C49896
MYLNGAQAGTAQLSFPIWDAQAPLRIGAAMAGSMDETVAYQRPLPAAGVADLFTQAQAAAAPAAPYAKASPALTSPSITTSASTAAEDGSFYKRINLEDCQTLDNNYDGDTADSYETWMKGRFAYGQSRIHESSYNYCWSSYIYILEFAENPFAGVMKRSATRSAQLQNARRRNGQKVEIEDDDAFRFRATWVMHSYLGNTKGHEFSAPQLELPPQKFKIFARLDHLAIVDDVRTWAQA